MNKLKISLIFLSLFFSVICCDDSKKNEDWKDEYLKVLKIYPPELTPHFPKEESIGVNFTSYVSYLSIYSPLQLFIEQKESKSTIDSLISISNKIIYSDTAFYIVNKYLRTSNTLSMPKEYSQFNAQKFIPNAVPIPNFYDMDDFSEKTFHFLKRSYSIYIVDAKPSKSCSEKLHRGNWHMPKEWQDGYSKGYAINSENNTVIYWLVVW